LPWLARLLEGLRASSSHERNEEESTMTKLLIGLLGAGVLATGGWAAATGIDSDPARTVSLPGATSTSETTTGATTGTTTTGTTEDVSGPCDEVEHRNDPRCTAATTSAPARTTTTTPGDDDDPGDISGRCDEAEHRSDPRCTGAAGDDGRHGGGEGDRDDRSGRGSGGDDDENRSGSNSGSG
jgi:hypothetical protein